MSSPRRRIATLLALCRALEGKHDAQDQPARHPIRWPRPIAWTEVLALSTELMVGPALWCAIHDSQDGLPAAVVEQLYRSHLLNTTRNLRLRRSLGDAVHTFNNSGIVPLLFNGALQLVDGTPRTAADRWIVGLDLLVPRDQLPAARAGLESLGYEADPRGPFRDPHALSLVRARSAGPIELQLALGPPPVPFMLPVAEAWAESSELPVGGADARALSPTHQVLHTILQLAAPELDPAGGGLPVRQLLTLSRLVEAHGSAADWQTIQRRMQQHGLGSQLKDQLWLAHRFAGMALPNGNWGRWPRLNQVGVLASFGLRARAPHAGDGEGGGLDGSPDRDKTRPEVWPERRAFLKRRVAVTAFTAPTIASWDRKSLSQSGAHAASDATKP